MYFGEHNVQGMFKVLDPLHLKLEKGPETLKEISFNHVIHSSVHPSILLSIHPFILLSIHPFFCPFIHSSVHSSFRLNYILSIHFCRLMDVTWLRHQNGAKNFKLVTMLKISLKPGNFTITCSEEYLNSYHK